MFSVYRAAFLGFPFTINLVEAQQPAPKPQLELRVQHDYLALHVNGKAPAGTTAVEYRFVDAGEISKDAPWKPLATSGQDLSFKLDIPLPTSRWSEVQVRAMKGTEVLVSRESHWPEDKLKLLTPDRIQRLPDNQKREWEAYLSRSKLRSESEYDFIAAECRKAGLAASAPAPASKAELEVDSDTPPEWFAGENAQKLASGIISYQTPTGGWSKAVDFTQQPRIPDMHWTSNEGNPWHYCGTIDNRATTEPIKILAGVYSATKREDALAALKRGLDYLFEAQYPNGGWPQNYPLESGYHEAITLNDNAMVHVLEILLAIADKKPPFVFADDALSAKAKASFERGIACLAGMQLKLDGKLTVWCAQHDPIDFSPVQARTKEPPSLSGAESAELVKFLMRKAPLSEQTKAMIEPAIAWFEQHRLTGLRKTKNSLGRTDYVVDSGSSEIYWARFYDLKTGKAIFPGAEDGINYATHSEMAAKNKVAYDFMTTKPRDLLAKEVDRWKKRFEKNR
ncbi:MAG: pectate lyase [Verrucomicrobiaceae bacterium]|nr:pectate lyase [Verrucomicrobiaceae bacterium]